MLRAHLHLPKAVIDLARKKAKKRGVPVSAVLRDATINGLQAAK